ncbi:sporulation protein YabP [Asaccharospora irregularis]|uniref:Sporulation protein YabP n=1 Tax=Asaccharospora irregularis DSM 2635 TaxID=1121321 RepID=A0A1M5S4W7_9FIRM|nr:sporulation protein YabP [Asaccharospora irregularis]SHH33519.1 sporulation protein YabP [Asaccharospora irregularis DSM 2635]
MDHNITLKDRSSLVISGVEHIYSFDDKKIELRTSLGDMVVQGEGLDMSKLNLDEKVVSVDGTINSIVYEKAKKQQESFFKKVFK